MTASNGMASPVDVLRYKPGWTFRLERDGALYLRAVASLDDARGPGERPVTGRISVDESRLSDRFYLGERLRQLLIAMAVHEVDEWLAIDGETVREAHSEPEAAEYAIGIAPTCAPQPVESIRPRRPTPSLLTVARDMTSVWSGLLPAVNIDDPVLNGPRPKWATGISWRAATCVPGYRSGFCDDSEREDPVTIIDPEFCPYGIYLPYRCDWVLPASTPSLASDTPTEPDYIRDASDQLDAVTAFHVANELWRGSASGDPSLMSSATDVTGAGGAVHPVTAVGTLLDAFQGYGAATSDGQGGGIPIIHAPSSIVTSLIANYLVNQQGDILYGPCGSLVSYGPGYPVDGTGNFGPGGDVAGAGNEWIYITGAVEYALGPISVFPTAPEDQVDRRSNAFQIWAQRQAIHRFDPLCVFACKAYVPTPANAGMV